MAAFALDTVADLLLEFAAAGARAGSASAVLTFHLQVHCVLILSGKLE